MNKNSWVDGHAPQNDASAATPGSPGKKKISNWNKAKIGDLVECYTSVKPAGGGPWKAKAGVLRSKA